MFALAAVVCFALALILHLLGGHAGLVTDFALAGLLAVALHLVFALPLPWRRP
jgi:hypothetical protein